MGNVNMEASQINYRGGQKKMSVEEALKNTSGEADAIAQLQTDVLNLNSNKANQITIAPFFSAEASYDPGDLVYYNGLSYRCVNAHEGEWDADDFAHTTIAGELDSLKSGLTKHAITFIANTGYTIEDQGSYVIGNVAYLNFFIKSETRITSRVNVGNMSVGMLSGKVVSITCPSSYVIDSVLNGYANVMIGVAGASTITVGDYITQEGGCSQINVNCAVVIS